MSFLELWQLRSDLYTRMEERGITMIDEIQEPPRWDGPDVLLRQTSLRALSEDRIFRFEDGTLGLYDRMGAETDRRLTTGEGNGMRVDVSRFPGRDGRIHRGSESTSPTLRRRDPSLPRCLAQSNREADGRSLRRPHPGFV